MDKIQNEFRTEFLKYEAYTSISKEKYQELAGSRYFCESLFWASQPKQAAKTSFFNRKKFSYTPIRFSNAENPGNVALAK
jgi:hypothetical protein